MSAPQHSRVPGGLALQVPDTLVDAIAERVVELLRQERDLLSRSLASPYLDVDEAASYLRASRQRVYDLVHAGAVEPVRDGRRLLFRRDQLDAYLAGATVENVTDLSRAA